MKKKFILTPYFLDQPIEADDVLTGGGGADLFHFRTLVNANVTYISADERYYITAFGKNLTNEEYRVSAPTCSAAIWSSETFFSPKPADSLFLTPLRNACTALWPPPTA